MDFLLQTGKFQGPKTGLPISTYFSAVKMPGGKIAARASSDQAGFGHVAWLP